MAVQLMTIKGFVLFAQFPCGNLKGLVVFFQGSNELFLFEFPCLQFYQHEAKGFCKAGNLFGGAA